MIFNKAHAEAIYSAMCKLTNLGGRLAAAFDSGEKEVCEMHDGTVICHGDFGLTMESQISKSAFAAAYGIQP